METTKTVWAEKIIVIEDLMTIQDVARITQFKVCTIRKFVLKDTIPYIKVGGGLRFRPSEIAAWINGSAKGGNSAGSPSGQAGMGADDDGHK
ncbi:helix-turn-helix domain-containing protein [Leadbettera azotonutricia]|uniref:Helix-turn-helix domain-containing protein n=1 Tax=Leadbettera azotonutricia (strain ATCC BAA-888 / DSM 13862 / ZAS-9) TaxID=545695 RepID=F5Y7K6_LEAAZ|nr:helix-turn-helix domain-containing protein [Leadbettera azotonutricia]AEF80532.1 hypothetical protein TREAZ_1072 [Leadbettera azotonutricia ZAS-9]